MLNRGTKLASVMVWASYFASV